MELLEISITALTENPDSSAAQRHVNTRKNSGLITSRQNLHRYLELVGRYLDSKSYTRQRVLYLFPRTVLKRLIPWLELLPGRS